MTAAKKIIAALLATATAVAATHNDHVRATMHSKRVATDASFQQMYFQSNYQNGDQPPGFQDGDSPDQSVIINNKNGTDNNSPVSTCPIAYFGGSGVVGSEDDGWATKASVVGFDTKSLEVEPGVTMPYYIERKDYTKVKRIVMVFQGKPRDAWRYPNLMSTDLIWSSAGWANGGLTKGPGDTNWSVFKALDALVDLWFNQTQFPNLNSVVIAGHSAGAILAQRYAVLREPVAGQDENMRWFIADAGSYAWPVDARPVANPKASSSCKSHAANCDMTPECAVTMNQWPYGLNMSDPSTMNVYGRSRMQKNKAQVVQDYFNRRVQYTFAELDDGPGDTHCEAQFQGDSHIARGKNLVAALQAAGAKGFHTTFVPNATHIDLEVFVDPASQQWLFVDGMGDQRNGSKTSTSSATSKTSSNKSSTSSSTASVTSEASARTATVALLLAGFVCLATFVTL
ncbi:unnamed protein product [Parajaminaea phylloscopi]